MPMMIVFEKMSYSPGSVVSGHVVIVKKSPEKVKGLTMRFIGRSSKLISELEAVKNFKKEVYFDEKLDVFGHDGTNTLLKVGESLFPFTFNLPHGLPSSFMWSTGNILYFVEAKLTRSSWKDDKRVSSRLQVEGIFDLNLDPLAVLPAEIKRHKYVQHLLSKSGPFGFTFKINRSGFVRGHSIPFSVEVKNLSKIDAKKLKISLLQEVNQDGKVSTTLVEQLKGPAVHSGEIQTWESRMKISPDIPSTNLGNFLNYPVVLSLQYFIHIELSLKSATVEPLCAKLPVTIGTIALLRGRDRHRLQQLQQLQGNLPTYPHNHTHFNQGMIHEQDCPLSQLIVPVSPSQFSPNSISNNNPSGITVHSSVIVTQHADGRRSTTPTHLLYPPGRNLDYFHNDENMLSPGGRLRPPSGACLRRVRHQRMRESPPPSYDEVVTEQELAAIMSKSNQNPNQNKIQKASPTSATGNATTILPQSQIQNQIQNNNTSSLLITISNSNDQPEENCGQSEDDEDDDQDVCISSNSNSPNQNPVDIDQIPSTSQSITQSHQCSSLKRVHHQPISEHSSLRSLVS